MSRIAGKENYEVNLREGKLAGKYNYVDEILCIFEKRHLIVKKLESSERSSLNVSEHLARLPLFIISGNKSWQGLAIGFPGNTKDLTTKNVGTPFLRKLLYPILDLFQRVNKEHFNGGAKCLYFMGVRFPDVFIRKFKLISTIIPHLIILTHNLAETIHLDPPDVGSCKNEAYFQRKICALMHEKGLEIPNDKKPFTIKYISYEVQTAEGTEDPEQLDILGYDIKDHSLVAFEIKGQCGNTEFKNLFTQGMEHRNWLEDNRMAVKLFAGPKGKMISTTKRVKLVLGSCRDSVPDIFRQLKEAAELKDKHMQISFVQIVEENGEVRLNPVNYEPNNSSRHT